MARRRCSGCCPLVLLPTLHHQHHLLLLLLLISTTSEQVSAVGSPQQHVPPLPPINSQLPQHQQLYPPPPPPSPSSSHDRLHSRHLARLPQSYPSYDRFPYETPSYNRDSVAGHSGSIADGDGGYSSRYGSLPPRYGEANINYSNSNRGSSGVDSSSLYDPVLRTAPLTSSKNKSSLGLFSKWGAEKKDVGPNPNSIESSLAAIFRGVAYGVSTAPTTTPKPTTTTTTVKSPTSKNSSLVDDGASEGGNGTNNGGPEGNLKAVHHVDTPYQDVGVDGNGYSPPGGVLPSSGSPTTSPTEVRKAGLENWQSDLEGAWEVHVYCSAASFSLLALIALLCIVRVHMSSYLLPRGYYVSAHLLVFLASFFRCILFFRDPYASGGKLPVALSELLFNTGVPCVTAAFSIVVLALLNCARIILLPLNLQSPLVFGIISCIYIFSNVLVDVLAGVYSEFEWTGALKASVQALTAGWTAAMCLGYMIIYYRIEKAALRQRSDMIRLSYNRESLENSSVPRRLPTLPLSKAARFVLAASLCGLTVAVLQVYGLMTPDGLVQLPPREPWVWFGFQTSCRLLEIIMWSCVCVAAALSSNTSLDKQPNEAQGMTAFSCKTCASCSDLSSCQESNDKKINDELYPTVCPPNMATRNFRVDVNGKMISADGRPLPIMSNNTMGPHEKEKGNRKSSTLHSTTSDMHLLWGGQNSNSSTSRPASMIFNDNGMVRFRTQMENGEFQDITGNFPVDEIPPGYMEHVYNVSYQRKPDFPVRDQVFPDGVPNAPLQQLLQSRMAKEMYGRVIQENGPSNSEASEPNTEYSYSEIPSSHPNDEYGRYASACSSVSAANSFDVRMYDDYEVASYYHSPINGPKSCASSQSHVYASLRPTHTNVTPHKFVRNARVPPTSSCFSSPQSAVSSVRSSQSPRHLHHHNSDSDLCSSATDRTQASSSQGNEDTSERYDNTSMFRPQMRRHLSHPNAIPDDSLDLDDDGRPINDERADLIADEARKLRNLNTNMDYPKPENRSSPTDSDDIYTPLMEQHLEPQIHSNSPGHMNKQQQNLLNKRQPQYSQLPQNFSPQRPNIQESLPAHLLGQQFQPNFDSSPNAVRNYNVGSIRAHPMPSTDMAVPYQKTSPYRSTPTSPKHQNDGSSPSDDHRREIGRNSNCNNQLSPSRSRGPAGEDDGEDLTSDDLSDGIYQKNELPNVVPFTRPNPPPCPARPSLAETWVHQARDGLTKTEFVRKGSRRDKKGTQGSPPNLVPSPVSPVANI